MPRATPKRPNRKLTAERALASLVRKRAIREMENTSGMPGSAVVWVDSNERLNTTMLYVTPQAMGLRRGEPMTVEQLVNAVAEAGAQNVILFPNGRAQVVDRWTTLHFQSLAELERWLAGRQQPSAALIEPNAS